MFATPEKSTRCKMLYDDIAGVLKTTAVVARTAVMPFYSTHIFYTAFVFVVSFCSFFVLLSGACHQLLSFILQNLVFSQVEFGPIYDAFAYCCNFPFLWNICSIYYFIILVFVAGYLSARRTLFINGVIPFVIHFVKNQLDWVFGEGL